MRKLVLAGVVAMAFGALAGPAGAADPTLLGDWNFDSATSGDASGHWSTFELRGSATVADGQLAVDGTGDGPNAATAWARALGYSGPTISDKTMVSWVSLDSTAIVSGGPIGLYKPLGDLFDSVVYAERQPFRWMAGSEGFVRTTAFVPGIDDTATGSMRQVAISYKDNGDGSQTISGCLNGVELGSYRTGKISFAQTEAPVTLFGPRAMFNGPPYGSIRAHIDESRLYSRAISCGDVADTDFDNVLAESDNCPSASNADQADNDGDGQGNACDSTPNGVRVADGPAAATRPATSVADTAATLNGTVNPGGGETTYLFEYGTTTSYGSRTPLAPAGADEQDHAVAQNLSGLAPGTTYHFRVVATNSASTAHGGDETFTTSAAAPNGPGQLVMSHRNTRATATGTLIVLRCTGVADRRCKGTVTLESTRYRSRNQAGAARGDNTVAFDLAAGETKNVRVQLPAASRTQLDTRGKAVVRAVATLDGAATLKKLMSVYPR
jgi:hypothetical protein